LTLVPQAEGVARLDETCTILRRMWTDDDFDFRGRYYTLEGARCEPKPVQRPGPPLLIGGWGDRTLRVVAAHADIWNVPGPPHNTVAYIDQRSRVLDTHCAAIGRDPKQIRRSTQLHVSYDDPSSTRRTINALRKIGITHFVLNLVRPFPRGVAAWTAENIIAPEMAGDGDFDRS
jgi:alkanesulfonate monooxygenase SsuD/methylene tetrahydromethanopterin reductase-like flavin-dependent oxidoreductase (luciferase family)